MLINAPPFDFGRLKIDQSAETESGRAKIIDALIRMLIREPVHAFQFDRQGAIHKDVDEIFANELALIYDFQWGFDRRRNSTEYQFLRQGALVNFF